METGAPGGYSAIVRPALCAVTDIPDGEARGFRLGAGDDRIDILIARRGSAVHGYVNACPHVGSPLDWTPDRFMSLDGRYLQCATHGALFRVEDGECVRGPCAGAFLRPVALTVIDGQVFAQASA